MPLLDKSIENSHQDAPTSNISSCLDKLRCVQQAAVKQQWQRIPQAVTEYESEVALLAQSLQKNKSMHNGSTQSLQHLLQKQHLVMRMIHDAQKNTQEHIMAANSGLIKVKRLSESCR